MIVTDKLGPTESEISLRSGRSVDRIPLDAQFSASVQIEPEAHPASYTMGTGSFSVVKRPGRGVDLPLHLAPRLKKECNYISGPPWPVLGCTLLRKRLTPSVGSVLPFTWRHSGKPL